MAGGTETFLSGTTRALRDVAARLLVIAGCGRCRLSATARAAGAEIERLLTTPVPPGISTEFVLDVALVAIDQARAAILAAEAARGSDFASPERVLLYRAAEILRRASTARVVAGTEEAAVNARLVAAVYAAAAARGIELQNDTQAMQWALMRAAAPTTTTHPERTPTS